MLMSLKFPKANQPTQSEDTTRRPHASKTRLSHIVYMLNNKPKADTYQAPIY